MNATHDPPDSSGTDQIRRLDIAPGSGGFDRSDFCSHVGSIAGSLRLSFWIPWGAVVLPQLGTIHVRSDYLWVEGSQSRMQWHGL